MLTIIKKNFYCQLKLNNKKFSFQLYTYSIKTFVVFKNGEVAALLILVNNSFQGIWTAYSSGPGKAH